MAGGQLLPTISPAAYCDDTLTVTSPPNDVPDGSSDATIASRWFSFAARPLKEGYDDIAAKTRSACRRAGSMEITFHALRATYATIVANQNLPLPQLAVLLGHRDIRTTAIYMRPESERAALDPRAQLGGGAAAKQAEQSVQVRHNYITCQSANLWSYV
jgi:hypothetical protein